MIPSRTLADMLLDDPIAMLKAAIVMRLSELLQGVRIVNHPGKLDIADMLDKSVADAPAIHLGWTRIRSQELLEGSQDLMVEFAAYIVAGDKVVANKRVEREVIALAIGRQLLLILSDIDTALWGLTGLKAVSVDPMPALVPIATIKDAEKGAFYCAVTWTQSLLDVGISAFDAPAPTLEAVDDAEGRASMTATFGDGEDPDAVPDMVRALWEGEPDA